MRPGIEMKKCLAETEAGEAAVARQRRKARRVVPLKRDVESEFFVQGHGRAADACIVQCAAVPGIDVQRCVHGNAQSFERIERLGPDVDLAAAAASDVGWREMRPARGIEA